MLQRRVQIVSGCSPEDWLRTWGWRSAKFSNSRATTTSWCPSITGRSPFFGRILILGSCLATDRSRQNRHENRWKSWSHESCSMNWGWLRFKKNKKRRRILVIFNRTTFSFGVPCADSMPNLRLGVMCLSHKPRTTVSIIPSPQLRSARNPWFLMAFFSETICGSSRASVPKFGCLFHVWGQKYPLFPIFCQQ